MSAWALARTFRMAALAAILALLPGIALAAVCDSSGLNFADHLPMLDSWLAAMPDGDQFRKFFTPESVITGAILIWLIASNSTLPTMTAIAWFLCLAVYSAFAYFSIDLADPYYQAAIQEGCVENSPRHIFSNLGFAVIGGLLTWQRLRRQKTG